MTITAREIDDIFIDLLAFIQALQPNLIASKDTPLGARIYALIQAIYGAQVNLTELQKDLFPSSETSTDALEKHATARLGENPRKSATISTGSSALQVSGTNGTSVTVGLTLIHSDGTRYKTASTGTISSGTATVDIESISTGTQVNKTTGESLSFESPPAGINTTATLVGDLSGGLDEETDEELLNRLLDAFENPPAGGRFYDYRAWATEITGISGAYSYGPNENAATGRRGLGIVEVAITATGTGSGRIPTSSLQTSVDDNIDNEKPALAEHYVIIPTEDSQDVLVSITPETNYEYDYEDPGSIPTCAAWNSGTNVFQFSSRPAGLAAGDRVLCNGEQLAVSSLGPGANEVTFSSDDTFAADPTGENAYSGGPLVSPIQTAIKDYMDTLGPAKSTYGDPNQQGWEDTLRLSRLYDVIMDVTGVKDASITTPGLNVTPSIDTASPWEIDLIVYGNIEPVQA